MKVQSTEFSRMLTLQRQTGTARASLDRAALEMSSGLKADKYKASGGNLARLFAIDRALERSTVHLHTIDLADFRLEAVQNGLGRVQAVLEDIAVDMLAASRRGDLPAATMKAAAAAGGFREVVGLLNAQLAGQSLYAGTATGGPALVPAEAMLAQIDGIIAGLPPADRRAAIDAYFAGTGSPNFANDGYVGGAVPLAPTEVGDGVRIDAGLRANAPELVQTLKGLAIAALVAEGTFAAAPPEERTQLLGGAAEILLGATDGVLALRARTGAAQEAVETARAACTTEREAFEMMRTRMLGADPYDAATVFQAMQTQLETVFSVTARLAGLRFVNFMR